MELIEVAPCVDTGKDILTYMNFVPVIKASKAMPMDN